MKSRLPPLSVALILALPAVSTTAQIRYPPPHRDAAHEPTRTGAGVLRQAPRFNAAVPDVEDGACQAQMLPAPSPKIAFLNYFWYRPEQFQCTQLVPSDGPIDSDDSGFNGYYHRRFKRLKDKGVDVLGFAFTGFDKPDFNIDGEVSHTWWHGRNLENAIWLTEDVELPFFIYYDLAVRTAVKQKVCKTPAPASQYSCANPEHRPISEYDLRDPELYHLLRKDLLRIKDDYILPHFDAYYMLEDEAGEPVLDQHGLPRPVIGIYIARDLVPNRPLTKLINNVTRKYRDDGLGQPAFILDTIFWNDPLHADVAKRFGTSVVAVTSFFPVNQGIAADRGLQRMLDWEPHLAKLYSDAAAEIATHRRLSRLQVWPGIASMFDNRSVRKKSCRGFSDPVTPAMKWHLHGKEDWRRLLRTAYASTYGLRQECSGSRTRSASPTTPIQSLVINYENEFRESAVTDCVKKTRDGRIAYPFHFACELLNVVKEEDRWR